MVGVEEPEASDMTWVGDIIGCEIGLMDCVGVILLC